MELLAFAAVCALAARTAIAADRRAIDSLRADDRWTDLKIRVASHHAADSMIPFYKAVGLWIHGHYSGAVEIVEGSLTEPFRAEEPLLLVIHGDACETVRVPDGSLVLVDGDVTEDIVIEGQSELVVSGSVTSTARIWASDIVAVWIGGDVAGAVHSRDALDLVVQGDFEGRLHTGYPMTMLHVGGDLAGSIDPVGRAATLHVDVAGHASLASLQRAGDRGYRELKATVGTTELARGIHDLGKWAFLVVTGDGPAGSRRRRR